METVNGIVRGASLLTYFSWELYWIISGKKADKENPKTVKPSLRSRLERCLSIGLGGLILLQLLGLPLLPFTYNVFFQLVGFIILILGICTCVIARKELGTNWADSAEYQIKAKHVLITSGVYRYIRHPIYTGLFLAYTGGEIVAQSYLFLIAIVFFFLRGSLWAKREEKILGKHFGDAYILYMKRTKMFIPYIW